MEIIELNDIGMKHFLQNVKNQVMNQVINQVKNKI